MTQQMAEETADSGECVCQHVNESESTLAMTFFIHIDRYELCINKHHCKIDR